jgi:hypothetical protein
MVDGRLGYRVFWVFRQRCETGTQIDDEALDKCAQAGREAFDGKAFDACKVIERWRDSVFDSAQGSGEARDACEIIQRRCEPDVRCAQVARETCHSCSKVSAQDERSAHDFTAAHDAAERRRR